MRIFVCVHICVCVQVGAFFCLYGVLENYSPLPHPPYSHDHINTVAIWRTIQHGSLVPCGVCVCLSFSVSRARSISRSFFAVRRIKIWKLTEKSVGLSIRLIPTVAARQRRPRSEDVRFSKTTAERKRPRTIRRAGTF